MQHLSSDGIGDSLDDGTKLSGVNNSADLEQDDPSGLHVSELKMEIDKICSKLPLILDVKNQNDSQRCYIESCPCGNKSSIPSYITSVVTHKDFLGHCVASGYRASDALSVFYKTASSFGIPMNLRSSGFLFEIKKKQRSLTSLSNASDLVLKFPAADSKEVVVSLPGRWCFESMEANEKARALLESSLLLQLGLLDGKGSESKSVSSELSTSPSMIRKTIERQCSELSVSDRKLTSCSSVQSISSALSTPPGNSSGEWLLYCSWKNMMPHFVFSSGNNNDDLFMASPHKVEPSVDQALDYVYFFRSWNPRSRQKNASAAVGKMKVSSSLVLQPDGSKLLETEFVLYGGCENYFSEVENASSNRSKNKRLSKKVADIFRSSHTSKHKAIQKLCEPNFQIDELIQEIFPAKLKDSNVIQVFPPNFELAAITVKEHQLSRDMKAITGGWGLKFLKKVQLGGDENSSENRGGGWKEVSEDPTRNINVVLPAGIHGGLFDRTDGPSGLIERWKSGGHCDCGGWDLGCPVTVLDISSTRALDFVPDEMTDDFPPLCFSVQGKQQSEPTVKVASKSKNLYLVSFQSSLSALQSFAVAIAAIHSRTSDLRPKL